MLKKLAEDVQRAKKDKKKEKVKKTSKDKLTF